MKIRKINTNNPKDINQFIQFPFELYKESAYWVPPFISDVAKTLNRNKHPFYEHSTAEFFLAENKSQTLGRLAVLDNRKFNELQKQKTAFFYYFEAVEDTSAAQALFDEGQKWAQQRGLNKIIGPMGFMQGDGIGLLVEGFEHRPAIGISYNFPYYDALLKQAGYDKKTDYFSGYLPGTHKLPQRFYDIAEKVKAKRNFSIKSFKNKKELKQWIPRIQKLYNESFSDNFEHYPISEKEAEIIADKLLAIADPRLIKLVMKEDDIIGFLFAFVDISAAIKKTKGRIFPFGWITLKREFKRTNWVNFNGTGLLPGHRGVGANAVLYTEMANTVKQYGFEHADIVQIEEKNIKSLGDMKAIGVEWYKKHRVYEKVFYTC
ncbi:hypothetical protein H8E88_34865 [candidate division KSB1 bacterium]|nr:hypothetical protein [candidate division KSB1 bacterium]MBL7094382.1 hypothetical protein [candidate division KSB1 bacterium]